MRGPTCTRQKQTATVVKAAPRGYPDARRYSGQFQTIGWWERTNRSVVVLRPRSTLEYGLGGEPLSDTTGHSLQQGPARKIRSNQWYRFRFIIKSRFRRERTIASSGNEYCRRGIASDCIAWLHMREDRRSCVSQIDVDRARSNHKRGSKHGANIGTHQDPASPTESRTTSMGHQNQDRAMLRSQ